VGLEINGLEAGVEQVTDPDEMRRLLATPPAKGRPQHWYLESRRADAQLMKELHHRMMGPPGQMIEVGDTGPVTVKTCISICASDDGA
jgi:hypothetical protein